MFATTPKSISDLVKSFCGEIDSTSEPLYIRVSPVHGSEPGYCMINVPRHVASFGGQVQYGWIIWLDPEVYIEAEFHALWRSPFGELIDITPTVSGEDRILFLPDSKLVYEHRLVKNIIKPLVDTPETRAMIKGTELRFRIKSKHFKDDRVDINAVHDEFNRLAEKFKKVTRNEPCPCGSGLKFKKCCEGFTEYHWG